MVKQVDKSSSPMEIHTVLYLAKMQHSCCTARILSKPTATLIALAVGLKLSLIRIDACRLWLKKAPKG